MAINLPTPSFLVAMPHLLDPNFNQSIILLADHSEDGAVGFVLNRPASLQLHTLLRLDHEVPEGIPAWVGGPVGLDHGIVLHRDLTASDPDRRAANAGIGLTTTESVLADLIESHRQGSNENPCLYPYRFLVGYAGWGAGQLEDEIKEGAWIQTALDHNLLFNTPWPQMWHVAMASLGVNPGGVMASHAQPSYLN